MNNDLKEFEGVHFPVIKDFWSWVEKAFTPSYQKEIDIYLEDCVDHKDLETRRQVLARRGLLWNSLKLLLKSYMKYDTDWPHVGTNILRLAHKNTRASALVVQNSLL